MLQGCFAARGTACASALCRVRCCCGVRGVSLLAVLLVFQPVAACAAAAAAMLEEFCCARKCLCLSPLRHAALLLCARSFSARGAACDIARCCGRSSLFFSALPRALPLLCAKLLFATTERAKAKCERGAAWRASSNRSGCPIYMHYSAGLSLSLGLLLRYIYHNPQPGSSRSKGRLHYA